MEWANEFRDIPEALKENPALREKMLHLICSRGMVGKVTEEDSRLAIFRSVLCSVVSGKISIAEAYVEVERECPEHSSSHRGNRKVFCQGWAKRHVRTQFSRFYNEAVIELLIEMGHTEGFVPHSSDEHEDSKCSSELAGKRHSLSLLKERLANAYKYGIRGPELKIPEHPHCSHVVRPIVERDS